MHSAPIIQYVISPIGSFCALLCTLSCDLLRHCEARNQDPGSDIKPLFIKKIYIHSLILQTVVILAHNELPNRHFSRFKFQSTLKQGIVYPLWNF